MPKLWSETIDSHRSAVRDAILDTTVLLVEKHGLRAVTMSEIAKGSGIGRATLYKYFPGVEEILVAWHERQVSSHSAKLLELGRGPGRPDEQLRSVLRAYAGMNHDRFGTELSALLHRGNHVARARDHLLHLLRDLLEQGVQARLFRDDVPPGELAAYCVHALGATAGMSSPKSVGRLVDVILDGLADAAAHPRRHRRDPKQGQRAPKHRGENETG